MRKGVKRPAVQCQIKERLKFDDGRRLGRFAQFGVGKVKEVCQERGLGEKEVVFERAESWDELLVFQ